VTSAADASREDIEVEEPNFEKPLYLATIVVVGRILRNLVTFLLAMFIPGYFFVSFFPVRPGRPEGQELAFSIIFFSGLFWVIGALLLILGEMIWVGFVDLVKKEAGVK